MPRPRTIDRDHLLNVAEAVVTTHGAIGLSFGAIAETSGLSKASVQSALGTREALIEAMLDRWMAQEQVRFKEAAGPTPSAQDLVRAHIQTTAEESDVVMRRIATLLATMVGSTDQMKRPIEWYASRIGNLNATTEEERRLRAAFLATEGVFFIRYLIGYTMPDDVWHQIFQDLKQMTYGTSCSSAPDE
jgi:AcrR family transcriptional regulator